MTQARLEHANITVTDAQRTAQMLVDLFDWTIRWHGPAAYDGVTYHVGTKDAYVALYTPPVTRGEPDPAYRQVNQLNHIGIVVDDLAQAERRVKAAGFVPHSHADYEPGHRFYFHDGQGVEFEVVSYQA